MTAQEFNEKWKDYISPGFGGLEFDSPKVTEYLDTLFEEKLTLIPDFKYMQIKYKFNSIRFYAKGISTTLANEIASKLEEIDK